MPNFESSKPAQAHVEHKDNPLLGTTAARPPAEKKQPEFVNAEPPKTTSQERWPASCRPH